MATMLVAIFKMVDSQKTNHRILTQFVVYNIFMMIKKHSCKCFFKMAAMLADIFGFFQISLDFWPDGNILAQALQTPGLRWFHSRWFLSDWLVVLDFLTWWHSCASPFSTSPHMIGRRPLLEVWGHDKKKSSQKSDAQERLSVTCIFMQKKTPLVTVWVPA